MDEPTIRAPLPPPPGCDPQTSVGDAARDPMTPKSDVSTSAALRWSACAATGAGALDSSIGTGMERRMECVSNRSEASRSLN